MNKPYTYKIQRWSSINALVFSAVFAVLLFYDISLIWLVLYSLLSFALLWFFNYSSLKTYTPFAGYANWITLLRLLIVVWMGLQFSVLPDITIFTAAIIVVLFDGVDGFIARKTDQTSTFGAYFDMETDAFYVCLMSVILHKTGYVGAWILPVGFLRYLYGAVLFILRWHQRDTIHTRVGQIIAGLFFIVLPSVIILPESFYRPLLIGASILLTGSFALSFVSIWFTNFRKSDKQTL